MATKAAEAKMKKPESAQKQTEQKPESAQKPGASASAHSEAHPDGAAELESIGAEIIGPECSALDKSGPGKSAEPARWDAIHSAALLRMAFAAVAAGRGAHWALSEDEADMCGGSLDKVLDKWLPEGPGRYGPEIALISGLIVIVAPRMAVDAEYAAKAKSKSEDEVQENGPAKSKSDEKKPKKKAGEKEYAPGEL